MPPVTSNPIVDSGLERFEQSYASWMGYLGYADSGMGNVSLNVRIVDQLVDEYSEGVHREYEAIEHELATIADDDYLPQIEMLFNLAKRSYLGVKSVEDLCDDPESGQVEAVQDYFTHKTIDEVTKARYKPEPFTSYLRVVAHHLSKEDTFDVDSPRHMGPIGTLVKTIYFTEKSQFPGMEGLSLYNGAILTDLVVDTKYVDSLWEHYKDESGRDEEMPEGVTPIQIVEQIENVVVPTGSQGLLGLDMNKALKKEKTVIITPGQMRGQGGSGQRGPLAANLVNKGGIFVPNP